ncbi:PH domain-containing protein [Natrarchaeobius chitinivorans]|uniref:PH domain-containing protein n=1 Tax=Natrarchaeobius chitinivorans TaxID=1679083 RepID=A0A3N6NEK3_NATCH|nr:PH domain-containing protein [Natrarchaeobius chitinivorans]RQG97312.1 PH domain-containing protein [Natrarchaeobius chitinivorans]
MADSSPTSLDEEGDATSPGGESATSSTGSDFEWLSLESGEEVVWSDGPDRRTLVPAFLVGIPLAIVLIGILIIVGEYLRVTNTHYVATDRALYRKSGVLSRDVKRIEHEKVQDISYSQSALGTQFGYGTVEVSTAGGSGVEMAFKSVPDPRTVQQLITELIENEHRDAGETRSKDDVLAEILTELRAIRTTLEGSESARSNSHGREEDASGGEEGASPEWGTNGDPTDGDQPRSPPR